jgi:ribonuclease Z
MQVEFLGTAAGKPSKKRNVTSIGVILEGGKYILIDCGEGTQRQIMNSNLKLSKLHSIYITHLHGDHIFGLHGLLCTLNEIRTTPLHIYGPVGIKKYIEFVYKNITQYSLHIIELIHRYSSGTNTIVNTISHSNYRYEIDYCKIKHVSDVECYAYKITRIRVIHKINMVKLLPIIESNRTSIEKNGIKPAERIISLLKDRETVSCKGEGVDLNLSDFIIEEANLSLVVALDNYNCDKMIEIFKKCDMLIHESTYVCFPDMSESEIVDITNLAISHGHSTNIMALKTSMSLNCKRLLLTHFSNRYDVDPQEHKLIIDGCHKHIEQVSISTSISCANDFDTFPIEYS